jgi:hypothetical protein
MVDRTTQKYRDIGAKAQVAHRIRRRQFLFEYKKKLSCVYCGCNNPLCLDLDHMDRSSKKGELSTMVTRGHSWESVMEELVKCQPVCRNCHNIKSILESGKMQHVNIDPFIPEKMKHLRTHHIPENVNVDS